MLRKLLRRSLRDADLQNAILELRGDICGFHIVTDIEAAAHGAGVTLLAQELALLIGLVLVQTLGSADRQVTVLQIDRHFILLEARQVHVQLVRAVQFADIGLHQISGVLTIQLIADLRHHTAEIKEIG